VRYQCTEFEQSWVHEAGIFISVALKGGGGGAGGVGTVSHSFNLILEEFFYEYENAF
jgi:hypothetical protein